MNHQLRTIGILNRFLIIVLFYPIDIQAQATNSGAPVQISNAEPSHACFNLGEGKEISLSPNADIPGHSIQIYEFLFRDEWSGKQMFTRLSGFNSPFQFRINDFNFGGGGRKTVEFNITPFLKPGKNRIDLVFANGTGSSSDSSCQQTTLVSRDALHVRDLQITSYSYSGSHETLVRINLFIRSYLTKPNRGRNLNLKISDPSGEVIFDEKRDLGFPLAFGQETELIFDHMIQDPSLWSPFHPDLYILDLLLFEGDGTRVEWVQSTFGIGRIDYQDSLMIINTDTLVPKIAGPEISEELCNRPAEEILEAVREAGCNVILSNNPLPEDLMTLCDQRGIIVLLRKDGTEGCTDRTDINRPSVVWIE